MNQVEKIAAVLPDGTQMDLEPGQSVLDLAKKISPRLAKGCRCRQD